MDSNFSEILTKQKEQVFNKIVFLNLSMNDFISKPLFYLPFQNNNPEEFKLYFLKEHVKELNQLTEQYISTTIKNNTFFDYDNIDIYRAYIDIAETINEWIHKNDTSLENKNTLLYYDCLNMFPYLTLAKTLHKVLEENFERDNI